MNKFFLHSLLLLTMPVVVRSMQQFELKELDEKQRTTNCLINGNVRLVPHNHLIEYEDCERELDMLVDEHNNQLVPEPDTLLMKVSIGMNSDIDSQAFDTIAISQEFAGETWESKISEMYLPLALFEGKKHGDVVSFFISKDSEPTKVQLLCLNAHCGSLFEDDIATCKAEYVESQNPCLRFSKACETRYKKLSSNEKAGLLTYGVILPISMIIAHHLGCYFGLKD